VKQEFKDLAKYRLERARDTLLDAQKYFKDALPCLYPSNPLIGSRRL